MSNCIYCDTELSERGSFCKDCGRQSTCANCTGLLDVNGTFCVLCGTKVGDIVSENSNQKIFGNIFELNEISESNGNKASRNIKLVCSDDAVANFGDFVERRIKTPQFGLASPTPAFQQSNVKPLGAGNAFEEGEEEASLNENHTTTETKNDTSELGVLRQIFRRDGTSWRLDEIELSATGKLDYGRRLTFLFLYLQELSGSAHTARADLNKILEDATVYDGNYRPWIANEPGIVNEGDTVMLNAAGRRKAQDAIASFNKKEVTDQWLPGKTPRRSASRTSPPDGSEEKASSKVTASQGQRNPPTKEIVKQWVALKLEVDGHKTFASNSELDKALLSLWAIRKATQDVIKAASSTQMEKFLFQAFEIKVFKRSLENALNKDAAKTLAVRVVGTTFQILPPGIKHIEEKFGI